MYYHICPYCGAALDPAEKCDCREAQGELTAGTIEELIALLDAEQGERGSAPQAVRTRTLLVTPTVPQNKAVI